MNDRPLETCPECGGPVRRLIGADAGILVKNSATGGAPTRCGKETPPDTYHWGIVIDLQK